MTPKAISDTPVLMGRPPLKSDVATHTTVVRLPVDLRERIEAIAGKNQMAKFIRAAIEAELARRESEAD